MPIAETAPVHPPFRVLVVEDEFLIAMELSGVLQKAGFEVLGPVSNVAAALRRIQVDRPDAAVLDVSLRGERVTPVAEVLAALNVPFVLASAYLSSDLVGERVLASARNLGKPTSPTKLVSAMQEYRRSVTE